MKKKKKKKNKQTKKKLDGGTCSATGRGRRKSKTEEKTNNRSTFLFSRSLELLEPTEVQRGRKREKEEGAAQMQGGKARENLISQTKERKKTSFGRGAFS